MAIAAKVAIAPHQSAPFLLSAYMECELAGEWQVGNITIRFVLIRIERISIPSSIAGGRCPFRDHCGQANQAVRVGGGP